MNWNALLGSCYATSHRGIIHGRFSRRLIFFGSLLIRIGFPSRQHRPRIRLHNFSSIEKQEANSCGRSAMIVLLSLFQSNLSESETLELSVMDSLKQLQFEPEDSRILAGCPRGEILYLLMPSRSFNHLSCTGCV